MTRKAYLLLAAVWAAALLLCGCGSESAPSAAPEPLESASPAPTAAQDPTPAPEPTPEPVREVVLTGEDAGEILALMDEHSLEYVDARASSCYEELVRLHEAVPGAVIEYTVELGDQTVSSTDRTVKLEKGNPVTPEELAERVGWLPWLEQLDILALDWPNEDSILVVESNPAVKVIWPVHVGYAVVPSNATCFSTLPITYSADFLEPLFKYCTDLVALDVGHQPLYTLEPLRGLKKLKVLIIADDGITDLSPLEDLTELEYLEVFLNNSIQDFSPLAKLTKLQYLNVSFCFYLDNLDFLKTMPDLKMGWFTQMRKLFTEEQIREAKEMHPDCTFFFSDRGESTGAGWRKTEYNINIRRAFQNWRSVEEFVSADDVRYREGVELIRVGPEDR